MSEGITKKEGLIRQIYLYNWLIYVAPLVMFCFQFLITPYFPMEQRLQMLAGKATIIGFCIILIIPFFISKYFLRTIDSYDGSTNSQNKADHAFKLYPIVSIGVSVVISCGIVILMALEFGLLSDQLIMVPLVLQMIGQIGIYSLFFFILFHQKLERYITFIPLSKSNIGMPFKVKFIVASFFSMGGIICLIFAPMANGLEKGFSFTRIYFSQILPVEIFALAFGVANFTVLTKGTLQVLNEITSLTERLSNGNYQKTSLQILSRDELGLLSLDITSFATTTKHFIKNIQSAVKISNDTVDTLNDNTRSTEAETEKITTSITEVVSEIANQSAGVTETQATMAQITGNINNLDQNIDSQAASVTQISAAIEQMVANIHSVSEILTRNTQTVTKLDEAANQGQKCVDEAVTTSQQIYSESEGLLEASAVIQHIAEQTNMLAMNAAIEAAHAGDAGKGFSVVADEIRKLAEESNEQSREITNRLQQLGSAITAVSESSQNVQKQFEDIFELTNSVKQQESVIQQAMAEQKAGSDQVLVAMHEISDITQSVQSSSQEILTGSQEIASEMTKLADGTTTIDHAMSDMSQKVTAIVEKVVDIKNAADQSSSAADTLTKEVRQFIV